MLKDEAREEERWLWNFLTAHAKRVSARVEVEVDAGETEARGSFRARLLLGDRRSPPLALSSREVADGRGARAWCDALAARAEALARELVASGGALDARAS